MLGLEIEGMVPLATDGEVPKIISEEKAREVFEELAAVCLRGEAIRGVSILGGEHLGGYVVGMLVHPDINEHVDSGPTWFNFHGTPVVVRKSSHRLTAVDSTQTVQA